MAGVVLLALLFSVNGALAQCKEVVWPTDGAMKAKAEESKVLYEDAKIPNSTNKHFHPLIGCWPMFLISIQAYTLTEQIFTMSWLLPKRMPLVRKYMSIH